MPEPKDPPTSEPAAAEAAGPVDRQASIEARVERALAPYRDLLDEATLAEFAEHMRAALDCHPVASALLARARPRAVPDESGDQPRDELRDAAHELRRHVAGGGTGSGGKGSAGSAG